MKTKAFLKKPCKKCGNKFTPNSHQNTICGNCLNKINLLMHLKRIKDSINSAINKTTKYKEKILYEDLFKGAEIFDRLVKNLTFEIKRKNK